MKEKSIARQKVDIFQNLLDKYKIDSFVLGNTKGEEDDYFFRTNLVVSKNELPAIILIDNTVYTTIQVMLLEKASSHREKVIEWINSKNSATFLKYTLDRDGSLILSCTLPADVEQFDPNLLLALFNEVDRYIKENYEEDVKHCQ